MTLVGLILIVALLVLEIEPEKLNTQKPLEIYYVTKLKVPA